MRVLTCDLTRPTLCKKSILQIKNAEVISSSALTKDYGEFCFLKFGGIVLYKVAHESG